MSIPLKQTIATQTTPIIRTVVFDLDNTLVDTLGVIVDSFNEVVRPSKGRDLSLAEVISYFGPTEEDCIRAALGKQDVDDDIQAFHEAYAAGIRGLRPYPGIADLLTRLRAAGAPLGLSTGKGKATTRATLDALGMADWFSVVMTGDDVAKNKPNPEPLLRIAEATGCAPSNMVMVGDALADVRAARSAGATALLVLWGHPATRAGNDAIALEEAHAVFENVAQLERWFADKGM